MTQDTLHHDLILNFLEQIICNLGIEYFFDSTWSIVQSTFVDNWESALANLLTELDICILNFSDSWYHRQSSCADWDFIHVWSELWKSLFTDIALQVFNLKLKLLLCFLFVSQTFFKFTYFLIVGACSHGSFKRLHSSSCATSKITPISWLLLRNRLRGRASALFLCFKLSNSLF
jgi:hypothetical protein